MSGTSETVAACCCLSGPCPCSSVLSSIVVNWTGSITLTPMSCLDYFQTAITQRATTGYTDCGWICSFSAANPIVYTMPSTVVSMSLAFCGGSTCYSKNYEFKRWYLTASPYDWTAERYCEFEVQDDYQFSTYTWTIGYGVSVSMPTSQDHRWKVSIKTGAVTIKFISTDPSLTCTPTSFMLDPNWQLPPQNIPCYGNCDGTDCATCHLVDVPAIWAGCGFQGNDRRHRLTFNAGTISIS